MSIRECKGDKGREFHPGSLLTYTSDFLDLFVAHAVTAAFPASPRPHGESGGGRERPPLFPARCGRGGVAQFTSAQHPLGGRSLPKYPCREGHKMTLVTGKMGRMSVPDIHEERLKTLRKQAVDRLRRRHSHRCPHCGYRGGCPNCPRCGEFCESGHWRRSRRR